MPQMMAWPEARSKAKFGAGKVRLIAKAYGKRYDHSMAYPLQTARRSMALTVMLLWAASLALPAATFVDPNFGYCPGILVALVGLFFGWMILQIGAFANPILLVLCGSLVFGRRASIILACIAEVLARYSFTWSMFPGDNATNPIADFASGFYVWQLAILLLTAYALMEKRLIASGKLIAAVPSPQS